MELTKENLLAQFDAALNEGQFIAYYQPQFNVTTGMMTGAEALARWKHPEWGLVPPGKFIPVLEEAGLLSRLDLAIFEAVCRLQRRLIDEGIHIVPISVNLSWADVSTEGYLEKMNALREQYQIPVDFIRIEIIESMVAGSVEIARATLDRLHGWGYLVELDDFGSGYSSLNVLKDLCYDILKLDMAFLSQDTTGRGGIVMSSVVRMAKWLKMPVISEGVETQQQAEFIKSVGVNYVQGYLFSRPQPVEAFVDMLAKAVTADIAAPMSMQKGADLVSLWDYQSLESKTFNSYVEGAAIMGYSREGELEFLRVNQRFMQELGMNTTELDVLNQDPLSTLDEENRQIFLKTVRLAVNTEEPQECEVWEHVHSQCCGEETLCNRYSMALIGRSAEESILYCVLRNITEERKRLSQASAYEQQFKNVTEQANIYYWEYTVASKEMRPCFRCMRDLGLPPLVKNYPEPAIEAGIFPPDYADMYREWHKQIAAGAKQLEAVIPLTVGRVPFHVRYTTEFDELGRPVKAYGSATLVTPEEQEKTAEAKSSAE